jgi:hypothetical protein
VAAALLVALMVLTYSRFFEPSGLDRLDQFCSNCLVQLNSPVQFDLESPNLRDTEKFIRTRQVPTATAIPDSVATIPTAGRKIFRWKGQWVSLTCLEPAEKRISRVSGAINLASSAAPEADMIRWNFL